MRVTIPTACLMAAMTAGLMAIAPAPFQPAKYRSGSVPSLPALAVGGGEVRLELTVGSDGTVRDVRTLRSTPPYTDMLAREVRAWTFTPAVVTGEGTGSTPESAAPKAVASTVLVAGMFRAPTLSAPTLGEPARDVGAAADETPVPLTTVTPPYPPLALASGLVLVEATVNLDGRATDARVIRSNPPFDEPALTALKQWTFRPARIKGIQTPALVYLIFGFAQPVT